MMVNYDDELKSEMPFSTLFLKSVVFLTVRLPVERVFSKPIALPIPIVLLVTIIVRIWNKPKYLISSTVHAVTGEEYKK